MARISVSGSYGLDMRDFNFSSIYDAYSYSRSSSKFVAYYDNGYADEFRGYGFRYDSQGTPTAGTVTSYAIYYGSSRVAVLDGASVAAWRIVDAAQTFSTADDLALIKSVLAGDDTIDGGDSPNYLWGFGGNDVITGGQYWDDLFGDEGNDTLYGYFDSDSLYGGTGNDVLNGGYYGDYLDGGAGSDTASYSGALEGVAASLANSSGNTGDASGDTYVSIENLGGSSYGDRLYGNSGANTLNGGSGNDVLVGSAGADKLHGGSGYDTASYASGKAGVIVSLGNPSANTNDAAGDTFSSVEAIIGTGYADKLYGNSANNGITGGNGNDSLNAYGGNDLLYGGAGGDHLAGGAGADVFAFKALSDSRGTTFDTIFDFLTGEQDKIDLSVIDANPFAGGDQQFSFIGASAFTGQAGELRYDLYSSDTYVYADVNGDKTADLKIRLDDAVTLTDGYFVL